MEWEGVHLGWKFCWHRDWKTIWSRDFEEWWDLMLREASEPSVYHLPGFLRPWSETIGARNVSPLFGVFHHQHGHSVLLPWVVVRHEGRFVERHVLEYAGRELSGYHNPLVRRQDALIDWDEFWRAVQLATEGACDQGRLRYVRSDLAPGWARPVTEAMPVLDLTTAASLDELLARCSQNHRGDVRRRFRRLEEQGDVELWVASSAEHAGVISDLRQFLVQHALLCHEKGYSDPFESPEAASFLAALYAEGLRGGIAFYGALRVGGESIAWILGLIHEGEFYWWRPAYHLGWKEYSPGKVLLALTLEHAISRGWKKVHFHAGNQSYKLAWKPDLSSMSSVSWYPPGVRSSTLSWYDRFAGTR